MQQPQQSSLAKERPSRVRDEHLILESSWNQSLEHGSIIEFVPLFGLSNLGGDVAYYLLTDIWLCLDRPEVFVFMCSDVDF